jgi:glycerophosphoryl diester phosphodiesterase
MKAFTILFFLASALLSYGQFSTIQVCGHRGGFYDQLPENSIAAFKFTAQNFLPDTAFVEFDLRKSKDGTIYIMHDETIDRTTNGNGKIVDLTDDYLNSLVLKNKLGTLTSERIPTFKSLLAFAKFNPIKLMLDVKADVWDESLRLLRETNLENRSIVLTFKPADSKRTFSLTKKASISCLISSNEDWNAISEIGIPSENLIAYVNDKTNEQLINNLKVKGIRIMSDASESQKNKGVPFSLKDYQLRVTNLKLDILVSDFPNEAHRALKK